MRMRRSVVYLVVAALLLAACGGGQTPVPPPAAATTSMAAPSAPPAPSPCSSPSPHPGSPSQTQTDPPATPATIVSHDALPAAIDTWVRPADGMTMVYVPEGSFPMGSTEDDPEANSDELPRHTVTLDGFWIDQTEVSNAQFVQFLDEHGNARVQGAEMIVLDQGYAQISEVDGRFIAKEVALERPVVMVTWYGADAYCTWAGGRLPTEAEWEHAARGPEGSLYPWGNTPPTCDLATYATCVGVPVDVDRHPIGASWCGALNMSGNVWEWVSDWFGPYSGLPLENPTGPASGDAPVLRGGGWHSPRWEVRATYRQHELSRIEFNG